MGEKEHREPGELWKEASSIAIIEQQVPNYQLGSPVFSF